MNRVLVFYAGLLLDDVEVHDTHILVRPFNLPDGAYYRWPKPIAGFQWYRSDHTPLADEHVPKELLVLALLLT